MTKDPSYLSHQPVHHSEAERVNVFVVAAEAHPRLEQALGVMAGGRAVELLQLALLDELIWEVDLHADDAHVNRPPVADVRMPLTRPIAVAPVDAVVVRGSGV